MTLQLEVGKTYHAMNGEIVRIDSKREEDGDLWLRGNNLCYYMLDGSCPGVNGADLIKEEEIIDPFARVISALDDAERVETEAMERIRESLAELRAAVEAAQKAMRGEG